MQCKIGIIGNGYWGKLILSKLDPKAVSFISSNPSEYYSRINEVNWVVVASPEATHFNIVEKVLNLGKNVFCEKPLALTSIEYDILYDLADKNNCYLYVDDVFNYSARSFEFNSINYVKWFKSSHRRKTHINELIFRLAYHDIYLLYPHLNDKGLLSLRNESSDKVLKWTSYHEGGVQITFEYDDCSSVSYHLINGYAVGGVSSNDPLKEMLLKVFNLDVDFMRNKLSTQYVGNYLDMVNKIV